MDFLGQPSTAQPERPGMKWVDGKSQRLPRMHKETFGERMDQRIIKAASRRALVAKLPSASQALRAVHLLLQCGEASTFRHHFYS